MAIISFRHRFVFIKTAKTGGSAIEAALSMHVEPGAVVTPMSPPVKGHVARNYTDETDKAVFWNHMRADEIRERIGAETFNAAYRFTVEREPVDKCLSHFHMLKNRSDGHGLDPKARAALTWDDYVDQSSFPVDLDKYQDPDAPDQLLVHEIIAYEELNTRLPYLMAQLGVPDFSLRRRVKGEYRANVHITADQVTKVQRAKIYTAFAETIARTGLYANGPA